MDKDNIVLREKDSIKTTLTNHGVNVVEIRKIAESSNRVYLVITDVDKKIIKTSKFDTQKNYPLFGINYRIFLV